MNSASLDSLLTRALEEDIGEGDHSTLASIPEEATGKAHLLIKEKGVLAGVEVAEKVFRLYDPSIIMTIHMKDGTLIRPGDIAFIVQGPARSILSCERLVLNIMQRMSGIATQTREYVSRLEGLSTRVLDTRKTTPGMRMLEKMAVRIGGGMNHRMGLYDMIMLKDNHIDYAGGLKQALKRTRSYLRQKGKDLRIEVEVRNLKDVEEVLEAGGVDIIMLDNFDLETTRKAVRMIGGRYLVESSGGITLENVREYAACGVDYVSVGALTHQLHSLDMSLKAVR